MTKEPEAQRQKLESSASCCSGAQSTAGLLLEHRRLDQQDAQQDADDGVSLGPGCPTTGAEPDTDDFLAKDDSDLEKVGSDSTGSEDSWHPRPREATLQGPTFEELAAQLNPDLKDTKVQREDREDEKLHARTLGSEDSLPKGSTEKLDSGRTTTTEAWNALPRNLADSLKQESEKQQGVESDFFE